MSSTLKQADFKGQAYQTQEDVYPPQARGAAREPQKVLDAIDEYGRTQKYLMNIGEYKSKTVVELIQKEKPQVMLELGGYVGYSAIAFGAAVREAGGKRYFSLEKSPEFGAVIAMLVDLAGLSDVVKVIVGSSSDSLRRLHKTGQLKHIDLLFLDHYKPLYTEDLKLCEELELVGPGSVYAADNVVKPGNPPYLEYVRSTVEQKRQKASSANGNGPKGRPDLLYDSKFVEGWEPSGVPDALEITRCVRVES
ncbi:catechol O-methyltransferase [Apiospora saccharicola]|uniref:catechol O-methyltransferase n=1 Tax=Apiospora saccharicola TaxID=335842 RepID=A0ABR1W1C1_9PEZI